MMSFRRKRLEGLSLPLGTTRLLADIGESKGRQALYVKQTPQALRALRETALIQSVESSNRIEGVTVAPDRLKPLVLGRARPRDRSEEEIRGYRSALGIVHRKASELSLDAKLALALHEMCMKGSGDAGQWKRVNNDIVELRVGEAPRVRFRAVNAKATPKAVDETFALYADACLDAQIPPLVAVAALVLDFLCVHPFRDGNGRVSRLLTLAALYQHGFEVGRYMSLERLVEETKDEYYRALYESSQGWHDGKHDVTPWLNHFLGTVRRAYRVFEKRADELKVARGAKTTLVEEAVASFPEAFGLGDIERACPGVSRDMIRVVLRRLKSAGAIECLGRGRTAKWANRGNTPDKG